MLVCLCKGVSDKKVRWLVQNGACSLREVAAQCRAGTDCGSCISQLKELVDEARAEMETGQPANAPAANE